MYNVIDEKSKLTLLKELDYDTLPSTQAGIVGRRRISIYPQTLSDGVPLEFVYNGGRGYLNLAQSYLVVDFQITDASGNVIAEKNDKNELNPTYAPSQLFARTWIKQFSLNIDGQHIYSSSMNHAYQGYLSALFESTTDTNKTSDMMEGFAFAHDLKETDDSYKLRSKLTVGGRTCQLATRLDTLPLFNQARLLLSYSNMKLIAYPNSNAFNIEALSAAAGTAAADLKYSIKLKQVYLSLMEYDLTEALSLEIQRKLLTSGIMYPIRNCVQMNNFHIAKGRSDFSTTLFVNNCPSTVVIGLVAEKNFLGHFTTSAFDFKPFNIRSATLESCNQTHTIDGIDFANSKVANALIPFYERFPHTTINPIMFAKDGFTFFTFNLAPDTSGEHFELLRKGQTQLKLEFGTPLTENIYVIAYCTFSQIISFDKHKIARIDSFI